MTSISAKISAILNNLLHRLITLDEAIAAILRLMESESGASLAAQRRIVEKACQKCGRIFKGLDKKVLCNTCVNTAKKRRQRERNAND